MSEVISGGTCDIRVLVAHHNALFRQGVVGLLGKGGEINVVGHVGGAVELVDTVERDRPDVVLLDHELPGPEIEPTVERVRGVAPDTRIVLITQPGDVGVLRRLIALGVSGCISADGDEAALRSTIRAVIDDLDRVVLSITRDMVDRIDESDGLLSVREVEVLSLAAKGLTSPKIATELFIAEGTVKRHLTNIYAKLEVTSRIQAVDKAMRLGVLKRSAFAT